MRPAHRVEIKRLYVIGLALHDPLESVADADDVEPLEPGADGRRRNHAVDAGRRAATDQDRQLVRLCHSHRVIHSASMKG